MWPARSHSRSKALPVSLSAFLPATNSAAFNLPRDLRAPRIAWLRSCGVNFNELFQWKSSIVTATLGCSDFADTVDHAFVAQPRLKTLKAVLNSLLFIVLTSALHGKRFAVFTPHFTQAITDFAHSYVSLNGLQYSRQQILCTGGRLFKSSECCLGFCGITFFANRAHPFNLRLFNRRIDAQRLNV